MSFKTFLFFLCFVFIPPQVQSPVQSSAFASGEEGGGSLESIPIVSRVCRCSFSLSSKPNTRKALA